MFDWCLKVFATYGIFLNRNSTMAFVLSLLALVGSGYTQSFAQKCQDFRFTIPDVKVDIIEFVPNGTNLTFPYNVYSSPATLKSSADKGRTRLVLQRLN